MSEKQSVLIVDDDEAIRSTIRTFLESEGYEVYDASSGQAALDMLLFEHIKVNLILLDLYMPVMDGWKFAHYLKKHGTAEQKRIPIVITSATSNVSEQDSASTFEGFLAKPFSLGNLADTCHRFCKAS